MWGDKCFSALGNPGGAGVVIISESMQQRANNYALKILKMPHGVDLGDTCEVHRAAISAKTRISPAGPGAVLHIEGEESVPSRPKRVTDTCPMLHAWEAEPELPRIIAMGLADSQEGGRHEKEALGSLACVGGHVLFSTWKSRRCRGGNYRNPCSSVPTTMH